MNCKNYIDLLTSFGINEEENKNAATIKSLNRFYNLKNKILYIRRDMTGFVLDLFMIVTFDKYQIMLPGKFLLLDLVFVVKDCDKQLVPSKIFLLAYPAICGLRIPVLSIQQ